MVRFLPVVAVTALVPAAAVSDAFAATGPTTGAGACGAEADEPTASSRGAGGATGVTAAAAIAPRPLASASQ